MDNKLPQALFLGLTGRMASGKGELIKIAVKMGFKAISLSDVVRDEVKRRNKPANREEMQAIGNHLRELDGPGALGKKVREKIIQSDSNRWIIDGIRNPAEILQLKKLNPFFLLGIEADMSALLTRLKDRGRDMDRAANEKLTQRLNREWGIGEPDHGQQVRKCMEMADYIIQNNISLKYFEKTVTEIIQKIINENTQ